ncbi:MAG TPA: phosphatase [Prevotellaceae bacterium]|nr:phosphatase [Prevotellaceae bacterium]
MEKYLETALFDLDGTLVDTEGQYTRFWAQVGEELVPDGRTFALKVKGRTLKSIFEDYITAPAAQAEVRRRLSAFEATMDFPSVPGALDFLADLRRHGVHMAVVTSSDKSKMRNVEAKAARLLSFFDRILTAEDFTASKPAPDCYLLGAKVFGTPLDHCIVFEDAPNGLRAGMSAGIFTIGLATSYPREVISGMCNRVEDDFLHLDFMRANGLLADFTRRTPG